jgi:hypothetical protein
MTEHPRMLLEHRVSLAAEFALAHAAEGFTTRMLAAALHCSVEVARYTRLKLERQLAGSPIELHEDRRGRPGSPDGWLRIDPDNTHHDVRLYCLKPR